MIPKRSKPKVIGPHVNMNDYTFKAEMSDACEIQKGTQLQHVISDKEFCKMNKVGHCECGTPINIYDEAYDGKCKPCREPMAERPMLCDVIKTTRDVMESVKAKDAFLQVLTEFPAWTASDGTVHDKKHHNEVIEEIRYKAKQALKG